MMINRRNVVAGTALVAIRPTLSFASALLPMAESEAPRLIVKIDGWSEPDQSNSADAAWIRVSRSWRAAWR